MKHITSAVLIIGDEILSGRTKDKNIGWIAEQLNLLNIQFLEARIISDNKNEIIKNVINLSNKYTYVFTSGGIGPTHDDITTESIAEAFKSKVIINKIAYDNLQKHYEKTNLDFNENRQKMAKVPEGSSLIVNPISVAPGFRIKNVFVMAGVPSIFKAMFDGISNDLTKGQKKHFINFKCYVGEGTIASLLKNISLKYQDISIGSYPWFKPGNYGTSIVVSGFKKSTVVEVSKKIISKLNQQGYETENN